MNIYYGGIKGRPIKKNRIEIDGKIALIYPNGEKDNRIPFIFDLEDIQLLKYYTIHADSRGGYPVTTFYHKETKDYKTKKIHRLITGSLCYEYHVDHINGNVKDNRRCNLRVCYPGDASNQANKPKNWMNHEMVTVRNRHDGYFQLTVSNGLFEDVEILYKKYGHLLEHYNFLYEVGLDEGIPRILSSNYKQYKKLLEQTDQGADEYFTILDSVKYIEEKVNQMQQNKQKVGQIIQEFKAEGKDLKSGFYEGKNGEVYVLFVEPKKSKDIHEADGEGFFFKYIENYQK